MLRCGRSLQMVLKRPEGGFRHALTGFRILQKPEGIPHPVPGVV